MKLSKIKILIEVFILVISISSTIYSFCTNQANQTSEGKEKTDLYIKGITSLNIKDTLKAEKYFKESIRSYGDAASYFELAKLYLKKNSFLSRNIAYEYFRKAALLEPDNIEYRYAFADLMKDFARNSAIKEYKKIILIDSSRTDAYLNLGDMKARDFKEFNRSVRIESGIYMSLQESAGKDFYESEKYFLKALLLDSLNYSTIIKLALLYEGAGKYEKGIPLLKKLVRNKKDDKDVHLLLGLLYYKTSKMKDSHEEYKTALGMMNKIERFDFTVNSVSFFLGQPELFESVFLNEENSDLVTESFWKASDPLILTDYNERLLEHYTRVAYSNLNFSVPSLGIAGWVTDMGKTVIRYGEPLNRIRIRPAFNADGTVGVKTEVWNYDGLNVAFTDPFSNGNYQFVWPASDRDKLRPQVTGNYVDYMDNLFRNSPSYYKPKYEGPAVDVPYLIAQFKSDKRNHTDLYINYLPPHDENLKSDSINYKVGIFFIDKELSEKYRKTGNVCISRENKFVHVITVTIQPDSGSLAFELIRELDKGTFSSHRIFTIKKFSNNLFDISDLLIANDVSNEEKAESYFKRNDLNIKPYVEYEFKKTDPIFLYYEIYNLEKDNDGLTNFEQSLIITENKDEQKSGISKLFSSITNFLGFSSEQKITLKSNYKTLDTSPQIYFQLDLNNFEPGEYQIKINIKDNLSGHEKEIEKKITWQK
ncbi:MAG: GWxTD domain-containing protein [Bacteroidota bacterium]